RQDFNREALEFWNKHDEAGRKGVTQIKHIMGLYKVWDTLLEKYPELIIDNCASGGTRLDIETLSRSVPLWRCDSNCHADFNPNFAQNHNIGLSSWLPYHGNGFGGVWDKYKFRSCHSAGLCLGLFNDGTSDFAYSPDEIRKLTDEYKSVRAFYSCDYYPVFGFPIDDMSWAGWQFHDPDTQEGIVMAFRRDLCLSDRVTVLLEGLDDKTAYILSNSDTGETFESTGRKLKNKGLTIKIPQKRDSRLLRYKVK
ncbi:MAG: alpha-galactosidase, partial [Firmicutes bacterium]|nr:alpha-galactosidase [Bacillota bacterium]